MEKALTVINQMKDKGIIKDYAIGGGMASLFYMEPFVTYDLDVMILFGGGKEIIRLSPIYDYLKDKGYVPENEYVKIEGIPVQFLPAYNDLIAEAIENGIEKTYEGIPAKVISKEYLIAIMFQTYRPKDRERLVKIFTTTAVDNAMLKQILKKHDLLEKYSKFYDQYLN